MPVDATTGRFHEVVTHDLNNFLSDLIWNSAAMWGLSQSGVANWTLPGLPSKVATHATPQPLPPHPPSPF